MRITRKMLHKIAEDTVTQRIKADRSIIAAYMQGTVMEEEFLLGGTADVDLVLVYRYATTRAVCTCLREIYASIRGWEMP
jgi:hypothetical protein